ncbi:MAG TPA: DUF2267 domain-containing protein [Chitinophagales bacterium]|nr:DUF2267 domain-containing protein [Chitinophagales bacterium]
MSHNFVKHTAKDEFLIDLAKELGKHDAEEQAGRIVIIFFRTLQNHLTLLENFQLIALLPIELRGLYIDQWKFSQEHSRIRTICTFIDEMMKADSVSGWKFFHNREDVFTTSRTIFKMLTKHISEGEPSDLAAILPRHIKEFLLSEIRERV